MGNIGTRFRWPDVIGMAGRMLRVQKLPATWGETQREKQDALLHCAEHGAYPDGKRPYSPLKVPNSRLVVFNNYFPYVPKPFQNS